MFKKNSEYRPGSLGGSVKLVLAAFMALALSVAVSGIAMAEVGLDGYISGQFGSYESEDTDNGGTGPGKTSTNATGIRMDSNAQINFSGKGDKGYAKLRLRVREDSGGALATWRHHVYWTPSDQLSIGWMGGGFGLPAANVGDGNSAVGTLSDGSPIGGQTQLEGFYTVRGLDVNFKLSGDMQVGAYILNQCKPSCTYDVGPVTQTSTVNQMTIVPYFKGVFGAITVGAYATSASGDDISTNTAAGDEDAQSITASAFDVQVKFASGDMSVSLEVGQAAVSPNSELLTKAGETAADWGDVETAFTGLGFRMAGIQAHYSSNVSSVTVGTAELEETSTEIAVGYLIPMGFVTLVPEFANREQEATDSTEPTAVDETSSTIIALGAISKF